MNLPFCGCGAAHPPTQEYDEEDNAVAMELLDVPSSTARSGLAEDLVHDIAKTEMEIEQCTIEIARLEVANGDHERSLHSLRHLRSHTESLLVYLQSIKPIFSYLPSA